ncbi:ArnT family glycosyltransferase [Thermopirellula anaerolimosa]
MHTSRRRLWIALIGLALSVRLGAAVAWDWRFQGRLVFGDSVSYWHLARAAAHGEPFRYGEYGRVFRTPGYPLVLAPLFLIAGESPPLFAARVLGAILGTLGVIATGRLAALLWDDRVGWCAAFVAAIHPECVLSSVPILSEAAFCPVWIVHLACLAALIRFARSPAAWHWAACVGLTAGIAVLIRPSALLWPPFAFAFLVIVDRKAVPLRLLALAGGIAVVVLLPWWIRNYSVTGRWILTTTQVGPSLYDGCNPNADGGSNMDFMETAVEETKQVLGVGATDPLAVELEVDRRLRREALRWARENPDQFLRLAVVKLRRFWSPIPNERTFNTFPVNLVMAAGFLIVIIPAAAGLVLGRARGIAVVTCWLPAVYFTLLHAVFVSSVRYRQPVIFGLIAAASPVLLHTIDTLRSAGHRANREQIPPLLADEHKSGERPSP